MSTCQFKHRLKLLNKQYNYWDKKIESINGDKQKREKIYKKLEGIIEQENTLKEVIEYWNTK